MHDDECRVLVLLIQTDDDGFCLFIWIPHGVCYDKHKQEGAMISLVLNNSEKHERKSFCCS